MARRCRSQDPAEPAPEANPGNAGINPAQTPHARDPASNRVWHRPDRRRHCGFRLYCLSPCTDASAGPRRSPTTLITSVASSRRFYVSEAIGRSQKEGHVARFPARSTSNCGTARRGVDQGSDAPKPGGRSRVARGALAVRCRDAWSARRPGPGGSIHGVEFGPRLRGPLGRRLQDLK